MKFLFWKDTRSVDSDMRLLADVLSSQLAQSSLFATPKYPLDKNLDDAKRIVGYSRQVGYNAWAAEAWMEVVSQIKRITLSKDQREVDQAIGALRSALHLLGISFRAQGMVMKQPKPEASTSPTPEASKRGA